jgi:hypothetical protein
LVAVVVLVQEAVSVARAVLEISLLEEQVLLVLPTQGPQVAEQVLQVLEAQEYGTTGGAGGLGGGGGGSSSAGVGGRGGDGIVYLYY